MESYLALANAVIELAVKDYREALVRLHTFPERAEYQREVANLESFFHSGWYEMLTDLDAEYLMTGVRRLVREAVTG